MSNTEEYSFKINSGKYEISAGLKRKHDGLWCFSSSSGIWGSNSYDYTVCGQSNVEVYKALTENKSTDKKHHKIFERINSIWEKHHLNDMNAGVKIQDDCIEKANLENYDYKKACNVLKENGLLYVTNPTPFKDVTSDVTLDDGSDGVAYEYGSSWLHRPIPVSAVKEFFDIWNEALALGIADKDVPGAMEIQVVLDEVKRENEMQESFERENPIKGVLVAGKKILKR